MRIWRPILLSLCVLLGMAAYAPAPQAESPDVSGTYNYLVHFNGALIGWARNDVSVIDHEGRKVIRDVETVVTEISRSHDGQTFTSTSTTTYLYGLDGADVRTESVVVNGGQEVRTIVEHAGDSTTISETVDGGDPVRNVIQHGDTEVIGDYRALRMLKEEGRLKAGEEMSFTGVDASSHALAERTWTIRGETQRKVGDEVLKGVEIKMIIGGRALGVVIGQDDWPLYVEVSGGFSMERVDEIPDPFKAEPVSLRNTMDANVAVPKADKLTSLEIHFAYKHDDGDGIPPICETNTYHDVVKYDGGYAVRMKEQKLDDDLDLAYPLEDVPDDLDDYLKATAMCQSDHKVLKEQALALVEDSNDAVNVARRIMRFTYDHLAGGSGDTGSASALQAYREKRGDCTEHSVLFVALARAAGLPARNVSGIVYITTRDESKGLFGFHQWAEVWLGEWIPVDATVKELGTSARFIHFEYDEPGHTHGAGRSTRCISQDISPTINAYTLATGESWRREDAPVFEFE